MPQEPQPVMPSDLGLNGRERRENDLGETARDAGAILFSLLSAEGKNCGVRFADPGSRGLFKDGVHVDHGDPGLRLIKYWSRMPPDAGWMWKKSTSAQGHRAIKPVVFAGCQS